MRNVVLVTILLLVPILGQATTNIVYIKPISLSKNNIGIWVLQYQNFGQFKQWIDEDDQVSSLEIHRALKCISSGNTLSKSSSNEFADALNLLKDFVVKGEIFQFGLNVLEIPGRSNEYWAVNLRILDTGENRIIRSINSDVGDTHCSYETL